MKVPGAIFLLALSISLNPQQTAEVRDVEGRLLAPCCYTQPVGQHMSDVAVEMRGEIVTRSSSRWGGRMPLPAALTQAPERRAIC